LFGVVAAPTVDGEQAAGVDQGQAGRADQGAQVADGLRRAGQRGHQRRDRE